MAEDWKLRLRIVLQRFWQPTSACLTCMPGGVANAFSLLHWATALQTGLLTSALALLLSFTPAKRLFGQRSANALLVGLLTAIGDASAHPNHYGMAHAEALVTGVVSGLLALAGSFLFEDRARRIRRAWARLTGQSAGD